MIMGMTIHPGEECSRRMLGTEHLVLAALECRPGKNKGNTNPSSCLLIKHDDIEQVVCTLEKGIVHQQKLDLVLYRNEEISFVVEGTGTVYITGYCTDQTIMQEDGGEESDDHKITADLDHSPKDTVTNQAIEAEAHPGDDHKITADLVHSPDDTLSIQPAEVKSEVDNEDNINVVVKLEDDGIPEATGDTSNQENDEMEDGIDQLPDGSLIATEESSSKPAAENEDTQDQAEGDTGYLDTTDTVFIKTEDYEDECDGGFARSRGKNQQTGGSSLTKEVPKLAHAEEKRSFECRYCTRTFRCQDHLRCHERVHTGERPYKCQRCSKTFAQPSNLKVHQRTHSDERPFKCQHCTRTFKSRSSWRSHERIHTGDRPYKCQHCSKAFVQSGALQGHVRLHTGERPFKCRFCSKTFAQSYAMKCHVRRHTGERPFKCQNCNKGFVTSFDLKNHERIHTGEKPYKCQYCSKAFTDPGSLRKHKRKCTSK